MRASGLDFLKRQWQLQFHRRRGRGVTVARPPGGGHLLTDAPLA